jgi:hypothetical protein
MKKVLLACVMSLTLAGGAYAAGIQGQISASSSVSGGSQIIGGANTRVDASGTGGASSSAGVSVSRGSLTFTTNTSFTGGQTGIVTGRNGGFQGFNNQSANAFSGIKF